MKVEELHEKWNRLRTNTIKIKISSLRQVIFNQQKEDSFRNVGQKFNRFFLSVSTYFAPFFITEHFTT